MIGNTQINLVLRSPYIIFVKKIYFMKNVTQTLILLFLLLPFGCLANPVTVSEAQTAAESFFQASDRNNGRQRSATTIKLTPVTSYETETMPFYVFNRETVGGFVLISGDERMPAVIGYADKGRFSYENMPENLKAWLEAYSEYIEAIQSGTVAYNAPEHYIPETAIAPLMTVEWGQDDPYNKLCPVSNYGWNMPTGCVATAMAQVMKYYRYPEVGTGSHSYWRIDGEITVDFSQSHYDWDNMPDTYLQGQYTETQADAVALLMRDLGVAVEMQYSSSGSGAQSSEIAHAMIDYFGYSRNTVEIYRQNLSTAEWMEHIYNELKAGRPIIWGASTMQNEGHQFVCDGIDANGLVHINWGWDGMSNGYFDVNYMSPSAQGTGGGTGGYIKDASIIINLEPAPQGSDDPKIQLMQMRQDISCSANSGRQNMTFTAPAVWNTSGRNFTGEIGVVLANDNSEQVLAWESWSLDAWYYRGFGSTVTIPEDVADGTYKAYFVSRTSDYPDGQYDKIQVPTNLVGYITIVIEGENVTVTPQHVFVQLEQTGVIAPTGEIIQGIEQNLTVPLRNNGNALYNGSIQLRFYDETTQAETYVTSNQSVLIHDDSDFNPTISVNFSDFAVGRYYVDAFANGEIIPYEGERSLIEVKSAESLPAIYLLEPISGSSVFVQGKTDDYYANAISITTRIAEQGDYTLRLWATNQADGSSRITSNNDTWYDIAPGNYQEFALAPSCYNLVPGNYTFYFEWLNPATNEYEALQPAEYNQFSASVQSDGRTSDIVLTAPLRLVEATDNVVYSHNNYTLEVSLRNTLSTAFNGMFYINLHWWTLFLSDVQLQPGETKTFYRSDFAIYSTDFTEGLYDIYISPSDDYKPLTPYEYNYLTVDLRNGAGVKDVKNNAIQAYFSGNMLHISSITNGSRITVADMAGRILSSMTSDTDVTIPLNVPKGIYIVSIATDNGIQTLKVAK